MPIDARRHEAADPETPPQNNAPDADASLKGVRVLVVEDEPIVRLDLLDILRDAGAIIVADTGNLAEGLNQADTIAVDAAVLDRNLNGESSMPLAYVLAQKGRGLRVGVSGPA